MATFKNLVEQRVCEQFHYVSATPAYGRDYKSKREVQAAWDAGHDFVLQAFGHPHDGRYFNKEQAGEFRQVNIRFKNQTQVHMVSKASMLKGISPTLK